MARVLITGGTGFIGSHLAHSLTWGGHEVLAYGTTQHYSTPGPTFSKNMHYRLSHLLARTQVVRGSTLDPLYLRRVIREFCPTGIVHLAALPVASVAFSHREEAFENLLRGLFNVLEAWNEQRPALYESSHFTYISSSMVYGDFAQIPMPEDGPTNPKGFYGAMKLMGEMLVKTYASRCSVPYTIVRPSAIYGPGDVNYRVLQIFVENAVQGKPVRLFGNPCADFTYVDDVVQGLAKAALMPEARGETFNITRGEGRTLEDAFCILLKHFPDLQMLQLPASPETPKRGALDISRAREVLDYEPRYSLEEGLQRYISYVEGRDNGSGSCNSDLRRVRQT